VVFNVDQFVFYVNEQQGRTQANHIWIWNYEWRRLLQGTALAVPPESA
jgi:hypothetical protein